MNGKELMKIENLNFSYGEGFSLKNINVSFSCGEKIAVLGSNGSGKSTFFLNINGVISHTDGNIYFNDNLITRKNINLLRKGVGIVFQDAENQMICSTVEDEVAFGALNLGFEEDEVKKRTDSALEAMRISHLKKNPVHYLSGGQKKSVSIADILSMTPQIIIFDEPTASLDPVSCEMFEDVLSRLEADNVTTLISTHDIDFAYRWADRVLLFDNGEIIRDDIPQSIFKDTNLLKQTKLKKPLIAEICEMLTEKGLVPENSDIRDITSLRKILFSE